MGEINVPNEKTNGRSKRKNLSTKVDLTPMVDLGFLLITFFIFTTSMSEPKAMKLIVPADTKKDSSVYSEEKILNIIIADDKLFVYPGTDKDKIRTVSKNSNEIRQLIIDKKKEVLYKYGKNQLMLLIKPTTEANYASIVNILNEITINNITRYALMEPDESEILIADENLTDGLNKQ